MSVKLIETGLQRITSEKRATRIERQASLSVAETVNDIMLQGWQDADMLLTRFGRFVHESPQQSDVHTPVIPFYRLDGAPVQFHLTGILDSEHGVFNDITVALSRQDQASPGHTSILFKMTTASNIWHDGSEIKTLSQAEFVSSVLMHIQMGCIEKIRLENLT